MKKLNTVTVFCDYFIRGDMVKHELRVASYELHGLPVESLKARVEIQKQELKFKSASLNPRVTGSNPRVTSSNPFCFMSNAE